MQSNNNSHYRNVLKQVNPSIVKDKNLFYYFFILIFAANIYKMVSRTCKYAIRAMLFVAQKSKDGRRVGVKEIARSIDSPEPFIAKILQDLGKRGLVSSAKGPHGGFYLEEAAFSFNLADIVNAIDGNKVFTACGLGLSKCIDKKPCPIHDQFSVIRNQMKTMMQGATLGNLTDAMEVGERFLRR